MIRQAGQAIYWPLLGRTHVAAPRHARPGRVSHPVGAWAARVRDRDVGYLVALCAMVQDWLT